MSKEKINVVVLGGGIAGLEFMTRTARNKAYQNYNFILVDKSPLHIWKPMLHTFAAGSQSAEEQSINFLSQAKRNNYTYQPGEVTSIDRTNKVITLAPYYDDNQVLILPERTLNYDYLVIALGSRSNDFNTQGVKEYAYTIDDLESSLKFKRTLSDQVIQATILKETHHLVIVGAGATGVELSGEIVQQIKIASHYNNENLTQYVDITVIQADDRVLPSFKPSISDKVQKSMENLGIKVLLKSAVAEVTKDSVILKDGRVIKADQVVWTAGVTSPTVLETIESVELSRTSQLVVNQYFQVLNDPNIFVIGDSSAVKDAPLAPTAQAASQQAIYLSKHFMNIINNEPNIPTFKYIDKGSLVSIGQHASFGMFGTNSAFKGLEFRGLSAKIAHIALYRQHQMSILGIWKGLCAWCADRFRRWSR